MNLFVQGEVLGKGMLGLEPEAAERAEEEVGGNGLKRDERRMEKEEEK